MIPTAKLVLSFAAASLTATSALAQVAPWREGFGPQAPVPSTASAAVDGKPAFWPGARYDAAIPTLDSIVGHENGERVTRPEDIIAYLRALAAAAPDRMKIFDYGRTWEGRPLIYVAIGAPEKIAALDELKAGMAQLTDPRRTNAAELDRLRAELPASVWIAAGVHGNEISSSDAALFFAYHLLAAQSDPTVDAILKDAVVFLDPNQNPDGRARFTHNFEIAEGLEPSPSRIAAERNEPWPGGRTNHYYFDMNRDWFALTQPETQGRIKALREWRPLVFVDAHEMGTDRTYYFAPEADPFNPHLAPAQRANLQLFGRNNAKWFDRRGFPYFTREVYDAFYPGYGASWPSYYGAIAMTYEQASARGLKARRTDGTEYHFRDTVRQHFTAYVGTAEAAAVNREKLLADYLGYQRTAIEEGQRENIRSYIFPAGRDQTAADKLAGVLAQQGVEVKTAVNAFSACGRRYEPGTHVVNLAQPAKRLIRTLLDRDVPLPADFLARQEARRARNQPDEIYDVTAWSMPLLFNTAMDSCDANVSLTDDFRIHDGRLFEPASVTGPANAVAYLLPWGETAAVRLLARAYRAGMVGRANAKTFTLGGRAYAAGTAIFMAAENGPDARALLDRFAAETGAEVIAVADSWVTEGPNFGSDNAVRLVAPRIAIAWDAPTISNQAGATRFVIERQFDYPATPVRVRDLDDRTLDQFDVLYLPGGGDYAAALGAGGVARLKEWTRAGGVLIGSTSALRFLAHPDNGFLSIKRENAVFEGEKAPAADGAVVDGVYVETPEAANAQLIPEKAPPYASAGVLARASVDPDHWLGAGAASEVYSLLAGGDIWTPTKLDAGVNVARFTGVDRLVASGHLWDETKRQYAYKTLLVTEDMGAGMVIGFTQDPTYRAYMDGMNTLFANALFHAPAHTARPR